jgi:ATP-dependent RNA helicase SUPV3L1/SUV3
LPRPDPDFPAKGARLHRVAAGSEPRAPGLDAQREAYARLAAELGFQGYPETFTAARARAREVEIYAGPPNSGKTHAAFDRLAGAASGAYLAPLRLLALEGRDRLQARGVACSLLTGEESVPAAGARLVSCTVEMVDTRTPVELAVVDEAQMLFDADRGWAWTQAIVGVPASALVVICAPHAVDAVRRLLETCGESPVLREFERKQHVELLQSPVALAALKTGDAVVAFSRRDVLMLRDRIAETQQRAVSVIYGALPPEVRRREAERFADGSSEVLVATDAIGMGLNLPIRRVLFSTLRKFDGTTERELEVAEVHQIAGRAGRYGLHEEGHVGVLREAEPDALRILQRRLAATPKAPAGFKARVAPNRRHVETIAGRLGIDRLAQVLQVFMQRLALDSSHFEVAALAPMLVLAEHLDRVALALELHLRFVYAQAPVDPDAPRQLDACLRWAANHARDGSAGAPAFVGEFDAARRLDRMEEALRLCSLWLWLDLRFPGVYGHVDEVARLRQRLNEAIERQLKSHRPLWAMRRRPR